eukprot:TRINITY_DN9177_c0_g1_i1.p2 TRINITY_DN9177_c0_g1~~TRINITY_DN9177_c0_g1_i1.p2  ORF type:complete len:128 (+),score=25.94 TRINITY_DN9177_c0_g1_i1:1977-2360(+)
MLPLTSLVSWSSPSAQPGRFKPFIVFMAQCAAAASKHNGDDNDDTGEPMAKRSHDGPPMMLMSVHQLVAIIRSQLVPRLVEPRHTNQLGLSQEFYEQINQLRSTMPLELMAASVLSVLSDVLNQPHA